MQKQWGLFMNCTFFGHKDAPESILPKLEQTIIKLIKTYNVNNFYIGNHGRFDSMVKETLKNIKKIYPHINYTVVLAYRPRNNDSDIRDCQTMYIDELDYIPKKLAIVKRNEWMINNSDYVITYVVYTFGGAYKFKCLSEKKGKTVINIDS